MEKKSIQSTVVKAGRRTFFFDINIASNNKKYLKITESAFVGEGSERKRNSFVLFPEDVRNFQTTLSQLIEHLQ